MTEPTKAVVRGENETNAVADCASHLRRAFTRCHSSSDHLAECLANDAGETYLQLATLACRVGAVLHADHADTPFERPLDRTAAAFLRPFHRFGITP